ncbi:glycosyltransferase family A protein [Oricola sp.]|uniref:glycosyltransferase family 2 protein n=1 Tax=Oricola sp. TaxID=1979950 RepID=UPI0025EAB648|nr:glycosyltransferase family A protein [Oricola sp.]MCI5078613.1 glycosyltransferase family 2 protein [Oricola sp.]
MTNSAPVATLVVPAYNVQETIADTLQSLLDQTFQDFEILVVDDGSSDETPTIVNSFDDRRIRLIRQKNRGLAGAHNTGIHEAKGEFIGFCDADDLWVPEKLEKHVEHLRANPDVGISFSGSRMIDAQGRPIGVNQTPKLRNITVADIFKRNPIGNGSAAVMRREALEGFAYRPAGEQERDWWFDETFRQSDDIEGWLRFALTQDWKIEGIPGLLTLYRIHMGALSANVNVQLETWLRMRDKIARIAPEVVARHGAAATAYQLRYLCRRAISMRNGALAFDLCRRSVATSSRPLIEEPVKTVVTIGAAVTLRLLGAAFYLVAERRMLGARAA